MDKEHELDPNEILGKALMVSHRLKKKKLSPEEREDLKKQLYHYVAQLNRYWKSQKDKEKEFHIDMSEVILTPSKEPILLKEEEPHFWFEKPQGKLFKYTMKFLGILVSALIGALILLFVLMFLFY